jgi:hypothetical protein
MGWTKRELITQAFEEIGLASYVFDLTPDQLQSAMRRLDAMIASWNANGIRIGYPLPSSPDAGNIDDDSGIPDAAVEAVYLNLALRLAPGFGKQVLPESKQHADMAYNCLANAAVLPTPERELPGTMPRGQGTKPWRNFNNPFVYQPTGNDIAAGGDGDLTFE